MEARWSLLEGAFTINHSNWKLANDIREFYLQNGYDRTNLTKNISILSGYQGNVCLYCGEAINENDIHVDHVLPRQLLMHDEIWNLVLSHSLCSLDKEDSLGGRHYIEKLVARNENIMGINHPWKSKIVAALGFIIYNVFTNIYRYVRGFLHSFYFRQDKNDKEKRVGTVPTCAGRIPVIPNAS